MLTEKMMEEAIINNPAKYIEEGLTLLNRQFRIGSYIFDLLFKDRHGAKLIVELQKGTLDRNHTYKIMDYYDEYKSRNPEQFVEIMIIANKIPRERRERLSSYGIAYKEIPESEFPHEFNRPPGDSRTGLIIKPSPEPYTPTPTEGMPRKGDIFKGAVIDLRLLDASGWRRRDIHFFKRDLTHRQRFSYPTKNHQITLIDTDGDRYELNFSKPDEGDWVCLGTPGRLKPWYQKKGFDFKSVNPREVVYFEYTGNSKEFLILTKEEYDSRPGNIL